MPRYFFDVRQSDGLTTDTEGEELADIDAASREAALAAVHLAKEHLSATGSTLTVEVRNEKGQYVLRAKVFLDIERTSNLCRKRSVSGILGELSVIRSSLTGGFHGTASGCLLQSRNGSHAPS
jgi:hypothetical protein